MKIHFIAAMFVLLVALFLRVSPIEFALLAISILVVLCAELLNTAIEAVVDLVSPGYHPLAKTAKDAAAGAVLMAACGAGIMGYLILSTYIFPLYGKALSMFGSASDLGIMVSVLVVTITVIMIKSFTGKGTPLQGGIPSGHAAVAFSIATAVSIKTAQPLISLLCLVLAAMVSHSRLLMHIHTMREIIYGSLLGSSVTMIIMVFFKNLGR